MQEPIPTISFKGLCDGETDPSKVRHRIASSILSACVTHGFFYLADVDAFTSTETGHVETAWRASEALFLDNSDEARAQRMASRDREGHTGLTALGEEKLDPTDPLSKCGDAKESFYIASLSPNPVQTLPPALAPFQKELAQFYDACRDVSKTILQAFGHSLGLGTDYFAAKHRQGGHDRLRLIHYPPAPVQTGMDMTSIRAGSHSDYGSITLLFQRDVSGLQVQLHDEWLDVPPKKGCIVVNVGDALEFWTSGLLRSTQHRVVMPRNESETVSRFSIAYFSQPDEDSELHPIDKDSVQSSLQALFPAQTQNCLFRADYEDVLRRKGIKDMTQTLTGGQHLKARLAASYA